MRTLELMGVIALAASTGAFNVGCAARAKVGAGGAQDPSTTSSSAPSAASHSEATNTGSSRLSTEPQKPNSQVATKESPANPGPAKPVDPPKPTGHAPLAKGNPHGGPPGHNPIHGVGNQRKAACAQPGHVGHGATHTATPHKDEKKADKKQDEKKVEKKEEKKK